MANSEIWDREGALARIRGREKLLFKLITAFCESIPEQYDELLGAIAAPPSDSPDYENICALAHGIKGAAANVGAVQVQDICARIEAATRDSPVDPQIQVLGQELSVAFPPLLACFNDYLSNADLA
ncbi:hypothetical protein OLMES_1105 [Oleiphilus messinensis]|uniref:HPt domain-containing protein n=1 Tax=Oleiphilus messinensis TaxID=141451 RepID=A0A1Y0I4M8_9GAMM|nr:Hpt domain-containing protein [Oleiphilus messinensis]ARU55190.1 hypothetical protein OLMES_1105 [Oleiphilus messinensis]